MGREDGVQARLQEPLTYDQPIWRDWQAIHVEDDCSIWAEHIGEPNAGLRPRHVCIRQLLETAPKPNPLQVDRCSS